MKALVLDHGLHTIRTAEEEKVRNNCPQIIIAVSRLPMVYVYRDLQRGGALYEQVKSSRRDIIDNGSSCPSFHDHLWWATCNRSASGYR